MRSSDRVFGLVLILVALAYGASALQIQSSFLSDPVGAKTFPLIIAAITGLCGAVIALGPDADPEWPDAAGFLRIALALAVLVGYCYALQPLGFLLPTAIASGILAWQITPRAGPAVATGVALSLGLYAVFRFGLGLGLAAFPRQFLG